jgi:hypothetical protein
MKEEKKKTKKKKKKKRGREIERERQFVANRDNSRNFNCWTKIPVIFQGISRFFRGM